ncbi:beta-glucosidase 12-like [Cryptomeria japonica]|uniref:beta-glucosidase 12-like n=1 Tax=Cryptomeria japonica TaxID=3369 RepID=UPI0027DA20D3|nr:beta-glucosidase 12-like [Cryptomeria japonica]XP_059069483.1 beta-glucosidase 12-like [Cryptomeria japonica]
MNSLVGWRACAVVCMWWVFLVGAQEEIKVLNRSGFPHGFIFGAASASYQYEGAAREGGRSPSIWDTFSHIPGTIADGSNGDVAVDQYHRYKEDVKLMKDMGMDAYRFSISWSRILPYGSIKGGINKIGVAYYNNLINELLKHDIKPFVTLFHWDLPQALEDKYGGFLSENIVQDFEAYSELCFQEFGDRVKHWITLNEPYNYAYGGYDVGLTPPGRHSSSNGSSSTGNSATEPYIVTHNLLLSHAAAVRVYKTKYQAAQKGLIGITLVSHWFLRYSKSHSDQKAAQRAIDFMFGWYMDPITKGRYPSTMRQLVGERLPKFTVHQSAIVKGSFDFLGLNYYTALYAADVLTAPNPLNTSFTLDSQTNQTAERNGMLIGPQAGSSWLHVYPRGIRDLLKYIKYRYDNPLIFITENGIDEKNDDTLSLAQALNDTWRIDYHSKHLSFVQQAIRDGSNIQGYFAWSLLDNFEWVNGYTVRFGLHYIDYKNNLNRYPKASVYWFQTFLK